MLTLGEKNMSQPALNGDTCHKADTYNLDKLSTKILQVNGYLALLTLIQMAASLQLTERASGTLNRVSLWCHMRFAEVTQTHIGLNLVT